MLCWLWGGLHSSLPSFTFEEKPLSTRKLPVVSSPSAVLRNFLGLLTACHQLGGWDECRRKHKKDNESRLVQEATSNDEVSPTCKQPTCAQLAKTWNSDPIVNNTKIKKKLDKKKETFFFVTVHYGYSPTPAACYLRYLPCLECRSFQYVAQTFSACI